MIRLLALLLSGLVPCTALGSPVFSNQASDVWVVDSDGSTLGSFSVGSGDWTTSATIGGGSASVTLEDDPSTPVIPLSASATGVLVNQMSQSAPSLMSGPSGISLKGLSASVSSLADPMQPSHAIEPAPGNYEQTIRVRIRAVGGISNPAPVHIHWSVNSGPPQMITGTNAEFFLHAAGNHLVLYHVEQGASATAPTTALYNLPPSLSHTRDTDGDGLPDAWEIANGLDPLTSDASHDTDGDGTPDFDEILRGTNPDDSNDHPTNTANDPDCDGWSTWDENLRGTDPHQSRVDIDSDGDAVLDACEPADRWPSTPVARRSTEAEIRLSGSVWADVTQDTYRTSLGRLSVLDPYSEVFFDGLSLLDFDLLSADEIAELGVSAETDLPEWLRFTPIQTALNAGMLPAVRIPGGSGSIVRVQGEDASGDPDRWVAKAWLAPRDELTPARYNQVVNQSWIDPDDWLSGYQNFLSANVVQQVSLDIDPASGLALALLEAAVAWHSELSEGGTVLLGNPDAEPARSALSALSTKLAKTQRSWVSLLADYGPEVDAVGGLASFRAAVLGYFADPSSIPQLPGAPAESEMTTEAATAALVQGKSSDDDSLAAYLAKLYALYSPAELADLSEAQRLNLLTPGSDADGDGITNSAEFAAHADESGDPDAADSDGDGFSDTLDPCIADPHNACLARQDLEADDDLDGVVNSLDNCLNLANPEQTDTNGDAIGDDCRRYANIRTPVANVRVYPGGAINFTSIETEVGAAAPGPLAYDWDFGGGAADSTLESPGPVTFSLPGTWPVTLTVEDANTTDLGVDSRTVTVLGDVPLVTIVGLGSVEEGQPLSLSAAASSPNGSIVRYDWQFGDSGVASGNGVSHSWAQDGSFAVVVNVEDVIGAPASDTLDLIVTDTAPIPAFTLNRARGPIPHAVTFTESIPTPYDGLAGISWNFDDGTSPSSDSTPTHVFQSAGTPNVELTATDGDGSHASVSSRVQILTDFALLIDSDGDGISDAYETLHGPLNPSADDDGDSMSNRAEYRADTDHQDPLDTPAGSAGIPNLLFADSFSENLGLRWSEGLRSSLAATSLNQSAGRLLFQLDPPALGELCQTASLVSFVSADAPNLEMTATLDPGTVGTTCIGILPDTDYFARAEACFVGTAGNLSAELRITEGDAVTVTAAGSVPTGVDVDLSVVKDANDFFLKLNGVIRASDSSTGSLGDVALRPFVSTESCDQDPGPVQVDLDTFALTLVPEPAQALQLLAGLLALWALQTRRARSGKA